MALTQLGSPYPVFTDLDGTPLDGGFVYIGVADDNPETAPILVYYDQELTQVAPQPLRTVNGYVMRNGAPAILYADATFSVTVRNRNGALVLYSPQSFGTVPGGGLRSQNNLSDVDSAPASLVNLGLTATAAELNFSDGVTSNIQTQLDAKAPNSALATGTWDPILCDSAGVEYDAVSSNGFYHRSGDVVTCFFSITVLLGATTKPTGANTVYIAGFPFLKSSVISNSPAPVTWSSVSGTLPSVIFASGLTSFGTVFNVIGTHARLYSGHNVTSNGPTQMIFSDLPAAGVDFTIFGAITYEVFE